MIIKTYNENHEYLVFIDIEFNNRELVQFAGLLFKRIEDETYQLMRSCNQYVTTRVCYPFMEYTSITNNFLEANGVSLKDVQTIVFDDFLADIDLKDVMIISHGLKNDRLVLLQNGINLSYRGENKRLPIDGYCTFNNSKNILGRDNHLTAKDLASECGYYVHHAHNAFNDVWAEVAIFTYLKKIEKQKEVDVCDL
jgi:hypothetical protein